MIERVKFYADTPKGEKNKYFCWQITSILSLEDCLLRFILKGFNIRAAWFERINTTTGEIIENSPIKTLQVLFDQAMEMTKEERDRIVGIPFPKNNSGHHPH